MKLFRPVARFAVFFLFILLLMAGSGILYVFARHAGLDTPAGNPLFPPEMNAARDAGVEFVVGDLGGVPVRIPRHFAEYVEYDGDPGFGEKRRGPRPQRDYTSRLASFGFYVRFPDMAGLSSPELREHRRAVSMSISPWIDVGLKAGKVYPGDGFVERYVKNHLTFYDYKSPSQNYQLVPENFHGLLVYEVPGIDPETGQPYRLGDTAKDFFVYRNKAGKVMTAITCSNYGLPNLKRTTCRHSFSMEPAMRTEIDVSYARYWLPHWKEIQNKVADLVWNFRTEEAIAASLPGIPGQVTD